MTDKAEGERYDNIYDESWKTGLVVNHTHHNMRSIIILLLPVFVTSDTCISGDCGQVTRDTCDSRDCRPGTLQCCSESQCSNNPSDPEFTNHLGNDVKWQMTDVIQTRETNYCKKYPVGCDCMIPQSDQCVSPGSQPTLDCDTGGVCLTMCSWTAPSGGRYLIHITPQ